MPSPVLSLALDTLGGATSFDLTALTGGDAGGSVDQEGGSGLAGSVGADYAWYYQGNSPIYKAGGGNQLFQTLFVDSGFGSLPTIGQNNYRTISASDGDYGNGAYGGQGSTVSRVINLGSGQINAGCYWDGIISDQRLATLVFVGKCEGGTFTAKATRASDGAVSNTLTLTTTAGQTYFILTHRSPLPTTIKLEIRRTVANDGLGQYIWPQALYIPPKPAPVLPQFFRRYMLFNQGSA